MRESRATDRSAFRRISASPRARIGAGAALVLLAFFLAGGASAPQAYLWSWLFWAGLPLGALSLELLFRITKGGAGQGIEPFLVPLRRTLPASLLLFLPILGFIHRLYPWADGASSSIEAARAGVMTPLLFALRSVAYLWGWFWISRSRRLPAPAGMILHVLIGTLASIDWVMSLESGWYSTLFGLIFVLSQSLAAYAWAVADRLGRDRRPSRPVANLLLAFAMTWVYLAFMQLLVVWTGDLPRESAWYLARSTHGWQAVAVAVVVGTWAVPMIALLFRGMKDGAAKLRAVAWLIVGSSALHFYWMVAPAFGRANALPTAADVGIFAGLGLFWTAARGIAAARAGQEGSGDERI